MLLVQIAPRTKLHVPVDNANICPDRLPTFASCKERFKALNANITLVVHSSGTSLNE